MLEEIPKSEIIKTMEKNRLNEAKENKIPWKKWGPYLSERQWGTVREDYSDNGDAWNYFPHDHPVPGHTNGAKMGLPVFRMTNNFSVLRLPCGMEMTLSSRRGCSD